jgi:phosphoglycerate dehydrogenase-like enzyme
MSKFRVGLEKSFTKPDGTPAYSVFDLSPLQNDPAIEIVRLGNGNVFAPADLASLDAVVVGGARVTPESVSGVKRLALVARFGVGFDNVDLDACTAGGIAVSNTPDGVRRPVAVSVIAFLLALTGRMFEKDRLARMGPEGFAIKGDYLGHGLIGRTLGLVGIGNIGAETIRMAKPFDMKIIAHDPFADPKVVRELGVEMVGLDDVFRRSDFISLHVPLSKETHHIADARRIGLMKKSAFLINTARGPVVDQKALTAALREKRIAGAGLDVFDPEPPAADDPILKLDNVILAPHALCHTDQCFAGIGASCVDAVLSVRKGKPPRMLVNRAVAANNSFKDKLAACAKL